MVEIFKTNIDKAETAERIRLLILEEFPYCLVNIDLDDCDKILRIHGKVPPAAIIRLVNEYNYHCEILE